MNTGIVVALIYAVIFAVMVAWMTQGMWIRVFNLTDKRAYIKNQTIFDKLNSMMAAGDVSLHTSDFGERRYVRINLTYKITREETVSNGITGENINDIIDAAYAWSVNKGFIKQEITSPIPEEATSSAK